MRRILWFLLSLIFAISISFSQKLIDEKIDYSNAEINLDFYGLANYTYMKSGDSRKGFLAVGWEYGLSKIYFMDNKLDTQNKPLELFSSQDKMLNVIYTTSELKNNNEIVLAGGYFSKCLCGVLLRKADNQTPFTEIFFDDYNYPFVSNLFCITGNKVDNNNPQEYRIFLGCSEGRIFFSQDFGETFTLANTDVANVVFKVIKFFDNRFGYALAGEIQNKLNLLYKTTDNGDTWKLAYDFSSMNVLFNDFDFASESSIWLFGSIGSEGVVYSFAENQQIEELQFFPKPLIGGIANSEKDYFRAVDISGRLYMLDEFGQLKYSGTDYSNQDRMNYMFVNETENSLLVCGNNGRIFKYINLNTNIDDLIEQNLSIIFDNKSKTLKFLNLDFLDSQQFSLQIVNIMGKNQYLNYAVSINCSELNLSALQPGIYFYRIFTKKSQFCGKFLNY